MISRSSFSLLVGLVPLAAVVLLAGCGSVQSVTSESASSPPVIDGSLEDWSGSLNRYEDGSILMGVRHDPKFLYVALSSSDRRVVQQVMMMGLELWIDPTGGKSEHLGIRFPMGMIQFNRGSRNALPLPMGGADPQALQRVFAAMAEELEVLETDMPPRRVRPGMIPHMKAKAILEFGTLTYELAIPLAASPDFAVGELKDVVGLALKTRELEGPPLRDREEMGEPGIGRGGGERGRGGMGGVGGAGSRGGGTRGGSRGLPDSKTIDLRLKVALKN